MKKQRFETWLNMTNHDLAAYEEEATIIHLSVPMYLVKTVDPVDFCVDIGSPHSCLGMMILIEFSVFLDEGPYLK